MQRSDHHETVASDSHAVSAPDFFHDPLAINLQKQLSTLLSRIPHSPYLSTLKNCPTRRDFLDELSNILLLPSHTTAIATTFRPLLLDLCARWLQNDDFLEEKLSALCFMLQPHEELYPVLHQFLSHHISPDGPLASLYLNYQPTDAPRCHRALLAYYRILQANREIPVHFYWSLEPLSRLIWAPSADPGVRFLAIRCYSLQSGMGEAERERMEREVIGSVDEIDCPIQYGKDESGNVVLLDGWLMPFTEVKRIGDARNDIAYDSQDFNSENTGPHIQLAELCPRIVSVHGVLMLRESPSSYLASPLISTPTTVRALRDLALGLSLCLPTLITSAPSAGKSLLLHHLASLLHPDTENQVVTIPLADTSLDPRSLLGSYISSPTRPGTFEWKEGILVRAMREGRWVVFEDIDRGSNEVLGTIKPLIESLSVGKWIGGRARLDVPSKGIVIASASFSIFATRSCKPLKNNVFAKPSFFGSHKFREVLVPNPTSDELRTIIDSKFPRLSGSAAHGIIQVWDAVRALGSTASVRDVGLRELEKFCSRIDHLLPPSHRQMDIDVDMVTDSTQLPSLSIIFPNPSLREEIYVEARDVFFGAGALTAAARAHADAVAAVIADHLSLSPEQREWVLKGRVPEFESETDVNGRTVALRIGRIRLPARAGKTDLAPPIMRPFAMHRPAVWLMSRIASAVSLNEPILLTGETGTGKTSAVTHMAGLLRRPLISLNLSQQTESSDLLGGFKPVDARVPGSELQEHFLDLFRGTFSSKKNTKFEESVRKAVQEGKWRRVIGLWRESVRLAKERILVKSKEIEGNDGRKDELDSDAPRKRRKMDQARLDASQADWVAFEQTITEFEIQHVQGKGKFAFSFVEGPLVKALRSGNWVLLDEINLASPETLEAVSGLLHGPTASISLTEQGSLEPVPRHPDFRLFACMNPATDVGKKDLPPNIRSRFTEIDVPPPDADRETLLSIVTQYISASAVGDKGAIMDVAEFYMSVKALVEGRQIADGSNHRPHFSMRTLARALTFASDIAATYSLRRALWEGCLMAFTMVLDASSAELVTALAQKHILAGVRNPRSLLARQPAAPVGRSPEDFVKFGPFFLEKGMLPEDPMDDYIMTPSVEKKLVDLARIIITRRFPVLIEGPTSSGKTSSIEYLAKRTGHRFVRINNHEHTDIQEYLGTYISDPITGKLVFRDGLLVQALRQGDWIVLDELNLAPTDVLEALNRLLDDNRELVIPETQEVVRPHPHFMLFATQNPPGLYAGRKVLSRAFRNRFLEVHFEDVPESELKEILCQRCRIAPSYGERIVSVFRELQKRRQSSRVFESKHGFATLRDLFRWAGRDAIGYQELAENGYMLLAERARRADDKIVVKEVIETIMKVRINDDILYDLHRIGSDVTAALGFPLPSSSALVWTKAMQRLLVLVGRALRFNEPVLLVGETGSGKTSICQVYADAVHKHLYAVNCHQNTETADLIGGLRPVRNRASLEAEAVQEAASLLTQRGLFNVSLDPQSLLSSLDKMSKSLTSPDLQVENARSKLQRLSTIFEWSDGPLVEAMRHGDVLLLDEISLADDSVLERLNSVLEPGRTVVLAERSGGDADQSVIKAERGFKLVATMNPGGDYGKKELSPALRNRFTEIWVPPIDNREDLFQIVESSWKHESLKAYTNRILDFCSWLCERVSEHSLLGLRDILAWVSFSNSVLTGDGGLMSSDEIFHHAAHMTILDGLSSLPQLAGYSTDALSTIKTDALSKLQDLAPLSKDPNYHHVLAEVSSRFVRFGTFSILRGPQGSIPHAYNLQAPTTRGNAMRVFRASQVPKPILLEGSPGVGKTSLITALANLCGFHLCRINLSDQTDLADLFGSDLPVESGRPGEFAWKNAEFLRALQEGHWVLLDEMNLAPQAVLEGLNAVLDHRGTVYVPELGRSFTRHPSFRIFAAQNPIHQGGGRKGLPKSFINRFTKVYIEPLTPTDLLEICRHMFPDYPSDWLASMIAFNSCLEEEVSTKKSFARTGSPWEFNLRDVTRWGALLGSSVRPLHPIEHLRNIYLVRFRTVEDRRAARRIFDEHFKISSDHLEESPQPLISPSSVQIGHYVTSRSNFAPAARSGCLLQSQLILAEAIGVSLRQSWLVILTGPADSGKTTLVKTIAELTGNPLHELSVNSATDTTDILGSFEQLDSVGHTTHVMQRIITLIEHISRSMEGSKMLQPRQYSYLKRVAATGSPRGSSVDVLQVAVSVLNELGDLDDIWALERANLLALIQDQVSPSDATGRFEWVDGPLVRAMEQGHWVLLDNANLCSPSVLDRLNSLCEPSGVLTLSERGYVDGRVRTIRPHPNFRLFMSVNPQHGELSRAMRNRGIEVALSPNQRLEDSRRLQDYLRLPSTSGSNLLSNLSCLEFESLRRALSSLAISSRDTYSPSGQRLIEDSASSFVLHGSALLLPSPDPHAEAKSYGFLSFAVASSSPAYVPYISRLAMTYDSTVRPEHLSDIHTVFHAMRKSPLWGTLEEIRRQKEQIWPVSLDLLSVQSFDFSLRSITMRHSHIEFDQPSLEQSIVHLLEILIRLYINNHYMSSQSMSDRLVKKPSDPEESQQAMQKVEEIGHVVDKLALGLLINLTVNLSVDTFNEIDMVLKLQKLSLFMTQNTRSGFNFSAIQTVVAWIDGTICHTPSKFATLSALVAALQRIVTPSSGLGLQNIWSMSILTQPVAAPTELARLEVLASNQDEEKGIHALRTRVLELMAVKTLPSSNKGTAGVDVDSTFQEIQAKLLGRDDQHDFPSHPLKDDPVLLSKELRVIASIRSCGNNISKGVKTILDLACRSPRGPLRRFIPYRHAAWALEENQFTGSMFSSLHKSWMQALWNLAGNDEILGPSALLQPKELQATIMKYDWSKMTLQSLKSYEPALERHLSLVVVDLGLHSSRLQELSAVYQQALWTLSSCFSDSFDAETRAALETAYNSSSWDLASSPQRFLDILRRSNLSYLSTAVRRSLDPIESSSYEAHSGASNVGLLGRRFIALFRLLVDLYVPNTPMDPSANQYCTFDFWSQEYARYSTELQLQTELEVKTTGNRSNGVTAYLEHQIAIVKQHLESSSASSQGPRHNMAHLVDFWFEVSQFITQVVSISKLDSLFGLIDSDHSTAVTREHVLQQSIAGFCQRLNTAYVTLDDISAPLQLSFLYLRLGLRLAIYDSSRVSDGLGSISRALVLSPSVRSASMLCEQHFTDTHVPGSDGVSYLLLKIAATALEASIGVDPATHIHSVNLIYEQVVRLWQIDRTREEEAEKASQSLYRSGRTEHDAVQDSEVEEKEFLALFPDFDIPLDMEPTAVHVDRPPTLVDHSHIQQIYELHIHLMASIGLTPVDSPEFAKLFLQHRQALLQRIAADNANTLPESLDDASFSYQLTLLHRRLGELQHQSKADTRPYNFYLDANVPEIRKATAVVEALDRRLERLIHSWPDQMVLHHLRERCDQILCLNLHSPVAKVLSSLEQLLLQTEDWELYANRENNLKDHRGALTTLIVEWRQMELACWRGLLETQAIQFETGVSDWWIRLYNSLVFGLLDAVVRDGVDAYLDELVPLIDKFIKASPLGQFQRRLELLQSFEAFLRRLVSLKTTEQAGALHRVLRILHITRTYYSQYLLRVMGSLSSQRKVLEKEVVDFIKLASWRDVNVQALKQSAQRTHRQLYKNIRKFRDIMRQPVGELLKSEQAGDSEQTPIFAQQLTQDSNMDTPTFSPRLSIGTLPAHLQELSRTFQRFQALLATRIEPFIRSGSSDHVEAFAGEVIATAKSLSALSVPADIPKERREKQLKGILVRKRKAWSDLLKELKRIGFATNVKPEVLECQQNERWIREQPIMPGLKFGFFDVTKVDLYFQRLRGLFPELRAAISGHHSDLQTRELQRGTMLLESGFSMALGARTHLVTVLEDYESVKNVTRRLRKFVESEKVVCTGSTALTDVVRVKDTTCRFIHALSEMVSHLETFEGTITGQQVSHEIIAEAQSLMALSKSHRDGLIVVVDAMKSTGTPILLQAEYLIVKDSVAHLSQSINVIASWENSHSQLQRLISPVRTWIELEIVAMPSASPTPVTQELDFDDIIDTLLVTVQSVLSKLPEQHEDDGGEDDDFYIKNTSRALGDLSKMLHLSPLLQKLEAVVGRLHIGTHETVQAGILRFMPFLDRYIDLLQRHLTTLVSWTGSLFKLQYVVCTIVNTLATQGFCQPPDAETSGEGNEGAETSNGMGLGEGTGNENASKEIEDESQVEGLKGEDGETDKERQDRDQEGDAIEMEDDFGGDMEDVPDSESQDGENEGDDDNDDDEGPDDQIGDVDKSDPEAVDEKLWGDEKGPEGGSEGKTEEDKSNEKGGESDVVAKEGKGPESQKDREKVEKDEKDDTVDEETPQDDPGNEDGETASDGAGAPIDDYVQNADTLDLPDDLDLGNDEDMQEGTQPEDEDEQLEDQPQDEGEEQMSDFEGDEDTGHDQGTSLDATDEGMEEDTQKQETREEEDASSEVSGEDAIAQPDLQPGEGSADSLQEESYNSNVRESAASQSGGAQGSAGQGAGSGEEANEEGNVEEPQSKVPDIAENSSSGSATLGQQQGSAASQEPTQTELSNNPLRSLGDTLREIRQRFDDILESGDAQDQSTHPADTSEPSQLEYLRPDDVDHEMQALGPVEAADQAAKLSELKLMEDDQPTNDFNPPMDIDDPPAEEPPFNQPQTSHAPPQLTAEALQEGIENALTQHQVNAQKASTADSAIDALAPDLAVDIEEPEGQAYVETELRRWHAEGRPAEGAENLWRLYESLTHDLSYALCEQLRLILEPSLATRLKGDYRTGKRLNMKKIIPYIASEYTKDKIWLRRTRPSQREYQVLIALDDSRSMAESHSVHLAYETLALVSKALSRLEVGDIGIAKFGEAIDVLHGFDEGLFTDQAGMQVMGAFGFRQNATNVLSLVESSLKILEEARERRSMSSSSAADLWQLEIIISDGICQDHEKLRTVLRKAEEKRIMIVFIVIDSLHSNATLALSGSGSSVAGGSVQNSILSMNQVAYKQVDGRMELQMQRYLDSFPFEYYVVLRNVEALPEVLSGTLKQFFERISEE